MATIRDSKSSNDKQNQQFFQNSASDGIYSNLNLNQNHKCLTSSALETRSISVNKGYDGRDDSIHSTRNCSSWKEKEKKDLTSLLTPFSTTNTYPEDI